MPTAAASRRSLRNRVRFLTAIVQAFEERTVILRIVDQATDRGAAITGLTAQFGWDEQQARVVLDLQLLAWTRDRRATVTAELANAKEALAAG